MAQLEYGSGWWTQELDFHLGLVVNLPIREDDPKTVHLKNFLDPIREWIEENCEYNVYTFYTPVVSTVNGKKITVQRYFFGHTDEAVLFKLTFGGIVCDK